MNNVVDCELLETLENVEYRSEVKSTWIIRLSAALPSNQRRFSLTATNFQS